MNFAGQRYYKINKLFLDIVGLWPYNNSIYIQIYRAFTFVILVSTCVIQIAKLLNSVHDFDLILYCLTYIIPTFIYVLKFISFIINIDKVREMMNRIQHNWNTLKDEKEYEIIRYHTIIGMQYTTIIFAGSILLLGIFNCILYMPGFLDFVHPLNESRSRRLPIIAEYFILDEENHFYTLLMHQSIFFLLGVFTILATESLIMVYGQHACGLFEVASYRLQHAFDNGMSSMSNNEKYIMIRARIADAVNIHVKSVEFLDDLVSTFLLIYLIMLILGIITITINMFRLIEAILALDDIEEVYACTTFIAGQYLFLFLVHYFGQKITNHSLDLFYKAYDVPWYAMPIQIQKLVTFILQRTVKGHVLNIGGVIMASLESFASMASLTMSYLAVIYSVR